MNFTIIWRNSFKGQTMNPIHALCKRYGPPFLKRKIWDREFSSGKWGTGDLADCHSAIIPVLEKYARGGNILDLGCGWGKTGLVLDPSTYSEYLGVDISDVAVDRGNELCSLHGRGERTGWLEAT